MIDGVRLRFATKAILCKQGILFVCVAVRGVVTAAMIIIAVVTLHALYVFVHNMCWRTGSEDALEVCCRSGTERVRHCFRRLISNLNLDMPLS